MAITICPESQPLPGEMRVNTTLERAEVYDGRKWVELADPRHFPMPGGSVALPRHSDLSTGITSIGLADISATAISSLSTHATAIRDGVLTKTVFNTIPIVKISDMDMFCSDLSSQDLTESVRLRLHEYIKENMERCGTCFHLKFQEEQDHADGSMRCAARCKHKGVGTGCTTIICPNGNLSALYPEGRKVEPIEWSPAMKAAKKEEVKPKPYIRNDPDRPATSDVDAW